MKFVDAATKRSALVTLKALAILGRKCTSRAILRSGHKYVSVDDCIGYSDAELETTKRVALTEPSLTICKENSCDGGGSEYG